MIEIKEVLVNSQEAVQLMAELSQELEKITGCGGSASFDSQAMKEPRTVFLIAYEDQQAVGCGALQMQDEDTAEIKRVYSKVKGAGIGTQIIRELEHTAYDFGYQKIVLETRKVNERAVQFYLANGYQICANYGKYMNRTEAVCFCKNIRDSHKSM